MVTKKHCLKIDGQKIRSFLSGCMIVLCVILSGCAVSMKETNTESNFTHYVKSSFVEYKKKSMVEDVQEKIKFGKPVYSDIRIKDVALTDFIRVTFSEVFKRPYILDRSIEELNKKIDVEISKSDSKNLFSVIIGMIEKMGVEVEDIDGVMLFTARENNGYKNSYSKNEDVKQTSSGRKDKNNVVPSDCIYTYRPVYSRAVDISKTLKDIVESDSSKIIVNENTNIIIFKTSFKERRSIVKLLRSLDERQKQIAVDVIVAEVSLVDDLSIGLEGFLQTNLLQIDAGKTVNNGYGLTGSIFISDWLKAVVQMGEKKGLIRINSNPYMLIADGTKSSIEIGSEYPILTSEKSTTDTAVLSTVEYRKTGIILSLAPVVSGDDVHLSSSIELSEGQKNETSTINSPSILSRKIKSDVILSSGQSLVVGGLISESQDKTDTFLPPVFKNIGFKTGKAYNNNRTELIVILNVLVLKDANTEQYFSILRNKYQNHKIN